MVHLELISVDIYMSNLRIVWCKYWAVTWRLSTSNFPVFFLALDPIPYSIDLLHTAQFGNGTISGSGNLPRTTLPNRPTEKVHPLVFISNGLSPIPSKLMTHIQEGQFVDMVELVPKRLCALDTPEGKSSTSKLWDVTDIVEWLQCFRTYIVIVSHAEPQWVTDLLGYQNLIIQGYHKCQKVVGKPMIVNSVGKLLLHTFLNGQLWIPPSGT